MVYCFVELCYWYFVFGDQVGQLQIEQVGLYCYVYFCEKCFFGGVVVVVGIVVCDQFFIGGVVVYYYVVKILFVVQQVGYQLVIVVGRNVIDIVECIY